MASQNEEIKELRGELKQKEKELSLLQQVNESVAYDLSIDEILKKAISIVHKVTRSDACLLYLYSTENEELILKASQSPAPHTIGRIKLKLGEGISGIAAKTKKPVAIEKEARKDPRFKAFSNLPEDYYEALLSLPMIHKNRVVGVINVHHKKPHKYREDDIQLLSMIANQVGGAIENASLYEDATQRARQIDMLAQVSKTITSTHYLEEVLHLIATMTASMMNSKICSIMLLDEKKKELAIVATQSLSEEYRKKANLRVGQSISGRAVLEKKPVKVLDVAKEPGYKYPELAQKEGLVSLLAVPMMLKDRVIGVLNSYTSKEHRFAPEEVQILQAVANQAAIAIENTKLLDKTVEMEEALLTRKLVDRAKGILMKEHGLSEEEAFRLIQKQSMNTRKTMKELAESIILASEIKK